MIEIFNAVKDAGSICISGHIRPDGDSISSCTAIYAYIQNNYNTDRSKKVVVYTEEYDEKLAFLDKDKEYNKSFSRGESFDLFIAVDCGSIDRLGAAQESFEVSTNKICIDHHISNTGFADINVVRPDASATCEVLFDLFEYEKIDLRTATALYTGIIHDTGVFKHSNTTRHTMEVAGALLEKGVNASWLIDKTFYEKTHLQNLMLGRCLMSSMLLLDGKIIVSKIEKRILDMYDAKSSDLDGVIDQLRVTEGVEVAIFLKEEEPQKYKVSMRSNGIVDVSKIAVMFGGGGHVKAAGCTMTGSFYDVTNNISAVIEHQLEEAKEMMDEWNN